MIKEEEEFAEGKKDAGVDKLNNKKLRNLDPYTPAYRNGYMSVYTKKSEKDIDEKIEEKDKERK